MSTHELPGDTRPAPDWWIYRGTGRPIHDIQVADLLPPPPPWRRFDGGPLPAHDLVPDEDQDADRRLGVEFHLAERHVDPHEVDMVNAALYLRRPLLVTGRPGVGKSSLAYRIARELRLGRVLRWSITSHTTLKSGLYEYDAIGRAQAAATAHAAARRGLDGDDPMEPVADIGEYIRLGRLGTAFLPSKLPRVLLIDELDKSEIDLPNDLLSIFEDGDFLIPELERLRHRTPEVTVYTADPGMTATIVDGRVGCRAFPMVVITSNGEREFPAAFLRRCLQLEMKDPDAEQLAAMVRNHLLDEHGEHRDRLVAEFVARSADGLPTDRLLEAVYLATSGAYRANDDAWPRLIDALWRRMNPNLV
jgi:MoxR-like ATPase